MVFLFTTMPASSKRLAATLPVSWSGRRSTSMRWLSVPPDTKRRPFPISAAASTRAFSTLRRLKAFTHRFLEGHCFGKDRMHVRPALDTGKDGLVDARAQHRSAQDKP